MGRKGARLSDVLLGSQKSLQLHEDLTHRHGAVRPTISQHRSTAGEVRPTENQRTRSQRPSLSLLPRPPRLAPGSSHTRGAPEPELPAAMPEESRAQSRALKAGPRLLPAHRHLRKQPYVGASAAHGCRPAERQLQLRRRGLADWHLRKQPSGGALATRGLYRAGPVSGMVCLSRFMYYMFTSIKGGKEYLTCCSTKSMHKLGVKECRKYVI